MKTIAAAGDIACDPQNQYFNRGCGRGDYCRQRDTSRLLRGADRVLPLGDLQYEHGTLRRFRASYDDSWGAFRDITRPAIGNHEFGTADDPKIDRAQGYYDYWGWRAGPRGKGYYSYDVGNWHMVALNSVCWAVRGCGRGSPQERWLRKDLAIHRGTKCTLAYWHHPNFSSGQSGLKFKRELAPLWDAVEDARAEVVLVGHDHVYERFAPQNENGSATKFRGSSWSARAARTWAGSRAPGRAASSVAESMGSCACASTPEATGGASPRPSPGALSIRGPRAASERYAVAEEPRHVTSAVLDPCYSEPNLRAG